MNENNSSPFDMPSPTRNNNRSTNSSSSSVKSNPSNGESKKQRASNLSKHSRSVNNNKSTTPSTTGERKTTRILTFGFPFSGQPDIVRSLQKDDFYTNQVMFNNLKDLSSWYFGQRFTIRFEKEIQLLGNLIYYVTTTCTEQPTLGEEYCDLLQVQLKEKLKNNLFLSTKSKLGTQNSKTLYIVKSSLQRRLMFVLYELIVPYLFDRGLSHWLTHYLTHSTSISSDVRYYISILKEFVQFLLRFNLAAFYVNGKYLQVSKRVAGIRYIYTGRSDGDSYNRPNFIILSLLIMLQQVISATLFIKSLISQYIINRKNKQSANDLKDQSSEANNPHQVVLNGVIYTEKHLEGRTDTEFKCSLCLERRVKTTATPCGHLYCWDCITECVINSKEPKCPICRQAVTPQSLSRLYSYDTYLVKE
ncbi:hypothetical protein C9374_006014 [Naegleria lovaniensis]|uniref:RING-type E3 ubiquitin transferase n=1 Tax=Naegleria lovaniensis TaxID=51637 RepID=A0AA88GPE6_NAELO|nr:Peroxin 10 (Pex10), putative [Naegleria lovaniensis]KAG2381630.1 hypothetical protein C9374_006014 [Naegleria lovaniensis]